MEKDLLASWVLEYIIVAYDLTLTRVCQDGALNHVAVMVLNFMCVTMQQNLGAFAGIH